MNEQQQLRAVKCVRFSDGVAPGCDPSENDAKSLLVKESSCENDNDTKSKKLKAIKSNNKNKISDQSTHDPSEQHYILKLKEYLSKDNSLPPLNFKDLAEFNGKNNEQIVDHIKSKESNEPTEFMLLANFKLRIKLIKIKDNSSSECWLFSTQGMYVNGQDEIVYLIENNNEMNEQLLLKQITSHLLDIYERTTSNFQLTPMSHTIHNLAQNELFLNNKENIGFIYFNANKHHLLNSIEYLLPPRPFLIGILIQKSEISWAKLFPIRLLLALGAQSKVYPCAIISILQRKSVFNEGGQQTIMNLLCDVRNFQYTLPQILGLTITINQNDTKICIPECQHDAIVKSILTSNECVFSIGTLEINDECESYLVACENETNMTSLTSKTMSKCGSILNDNKTTRLTKSIGCTFVVFNGSFKSSIGKLSIIEDGVMIQIDMDMLLKLKESLKEMKSFRIQCLNNDVISIEWTKVNKFLNKFVKSPIDGLSMCGFKSLRIKNSFEYSSTLSKKCIRWSEIFLIQIQHDVGEDAEVEAAAAAATSLNRSTFNLNQFTERIAKTFCKSFASLLDDLIDETSTSILNGTIRLALRIQISSDDVSYKIGLNEQQIVNQRYLTHLDNDLIAILHSTNAFNRMNLNLEFLFVIMDRIS